MFNMFQGRNIMLKGHSRQKLSTSWHPVSREREEEVGTQILYSFTLGRPRHEDHYEVEATLGYKLDCVERQGERKKFMYILLIKHI